jgi:hypothetical protein
MPVKGRRGDADPHLIDTGFHAAGSKQARHRQRRRHGCATLAASHIGDATVLVMMICPHGRATLRR